jgi:hypothetical protein
MHPYVATKHRNRYPANTNHIIVPRPVSPIAAVVDLDNMLHRGFDRHSGRPRPQAGIDVVGLCAELRCRGVSSGTICRNKHFPAHLAQLWRSQGFEVLPVGRNCDDAVKQEALRYVSIGKRTIILMAGDGDYVKLVDQLHNLGVRLEVWARRANYSQELARSADRVRFIDWFLSAAAA